MNVLKLKSPAKLNLYLRILNKRPDGYNNIVTLFERINLFDDIVITQRPEGIKIICDNPQVPTGSANLAYKAARFLLEYAGIKKGCQIEIVKRIPPKSGLGGGSSNAAAALLGLNRLWRLKLSKEELAKIAVKVGADVSFFLLNKSFAIGTGIGDKLEVLKRPSRPIWHVLITPKEGLSTRLIYESWDKINCKGSCKFGLTLALRDVKILHHSIQKNNINLLGKSLHNDLERSAESESRILLKIKGLLSAAQPVKGVLMSGSGATIFGIVHLRKEAREVASQAANLNSSWQIFVVKTY